MEGGWYASSQSPRAMATATRNVDIVMHDFGATTTSDATKTDAVTTASKDATCLILAPDMADVEEAPGSAHVTRDGLAKPVTLRNVQLGLKEFRRKSRAIQFVETA